MIPCREGDLWKPEIHLETGQIANWEKGVTADIFYKVCDQGEYFLLGERNKIIAKLNRHYVPSFLAINEEGHGDYIIFTIDADGIIKGWKRPEIESYSWSLLEG